MRDWIAQHAKKPFDEFDDQTQILEQGILSSLDIVEFVLFIESLRGEEVDVEDIEPDVFTNIDSLFVAFFPES